MTEIKICGLFRPEDIEAVNTYRPDYAGFIIGFPKSHRNITPADLIRLTEKLDRRIRRVGVFVDAPVPFVARLLAEGRIDIAQLHGHEDNAYIAELREAAGPQAVIWQAYRADSTDQIQKALTSAADRILLDAGQGAGKTFDWDLIRQVPQAAERGYILAGGLSEANLADAIQRLHPLCIDLSSGVETDRKKDPDKIRKCVEIVRSMSQ